MPQQNATKLSQSVRRKRFSSITESTLAVLVSIAIIMLLQGGKDDNEDVEEEDTAIATLVTDPVHTESSLSQSDEVVLPMIPADLAAEWQAQKFDSITAALLEQASQAVAAEDLDQLGQSMTLLGASALRLGDADSAGVYLDEALSVYEESGDDIGIANVELLRGELNLMTRAKARRAARAYDAQQLAGWKIAKGRFHDAIDELEHVISEHLALDRYGAAAEAYRALYKGYRAHGQDHEALQAGREIVKLHASSGRPLQAHAMLQSLQADGLEASAIAELKSQTSNLQHEYEDSVRQMSRAMDYEQLYYHFIHAGDPVRAWQFRLKSQHSLRGVSKRAMHRRQTGVLALLYNSNEDMKQAQRSLQRASELFANHDEHSLSDYSDRLQSEIF